MNNKKTVLHIIQSLDNGGCENMLLRTLPLIDNFEHIIITLNREGELSDKFKEKGFKLIDLKQNSVINPLSYLRLIKNVRTIDPDIIITYLFHADIIGRLMVQFFTKYKTLPFLRTTYNHPKYWIARLIEKLTKYFVKHYLANSESVKDFYAKNIGVPPEKITVVPNGIDVAYYDTTQRDENLRSELGINSEEIAIICVANLHINKGHKYLLEAFENVYPENKNIKLLLVGDGDEKERLQKQIENYQSKNNVLFLRKRTDIPKLLKISDIFVLPTIFEGMSNAIMEAMASGLAIATTNIIENKELILDNYNGLLFNPRDSSDIYSKLKKLIFDQRLRINLSGNARKTIFEKFNLNAVASRWKNFLNTL